ncbi:MAG: GDSL-type esterase/lipase family protein [Planctomycetia bacterium]|nr:GDSL-type esterase/lipase family protein [Planctomycetia bacterium]
MLKRSVRWCLVLCAFVACAANFAAAEEVKDACATTVADGSRLGDDWWGKRYNQQKEQMEQGNVDLIMIGDSITDFWATAGRDIWKKYYGNRNALNFGISGDKTQHVIWRLENSPLDKISPKLAVIMIGTNNVGRNDYTPEDTVLGIQTIVNKVQQAWPETKVLLLEVFPRANKATDSQRLSVNKINEGLRTIYADGKVDRVTLFSLADKFLTEDGTLPPEVMPDFLHPNAEGYIRWAEAIAPFVDEALNAKACVATTPADKLNEQWWKDRYEQEKARMEQGNVDLIMIGDSITHNWENPGKDTWQKYYANRNAMNFGIGGDRTEHVLWRLDNCPLDKISPKTAVIMIGTNNVGHGTSSPEDTVLGIEAIVNRVKTAWPNAKILLLEVFPRGGTADDGMRVAVNKINEGLRPIYADGKVANVTLYSLTEFFLDDQGILPAAIMPDGLHPSPAGHEIWAEKIEPFIQQAL